MIRMRLLTTFSLALLVTLNVHAQGLIWSASGSSENTIAAPGGSWQIAFDYVSDPNFATSPSLNPVTRMFSMTLSTNDAGRTFFANAANEPGFVGFTAGLTDGTNGYVRFAESIGSWSTASEQLFLGRSAAAPDLAGYNITQIGFRVNNFYDQYFAPDDNYYRHLDYSLDFYGAPVPEPSTWALLGLGGTAALLLRRKARR